MSFWKLRKAGKAQKDNEKLRKPKNQKKSHGKTEKAYFFCGKPEALYTSKRNDHDCKEDGKVSQGFAHLYPIPCSIQIILLSYDLACGKTTRDWFCTSKVNVIVSIIG